MKSIYLPYSLPQLFSIDDPEIFLDLSLAAFRHQYQFNRVYKAFCNGLGIEETSVKTLYDIPFLPIELFKEHEVVTGEGTIQKKFKSSGTTDGHQSVHFLLDEEWYRKTLLEGFTRVFGDPSLYSFIALLPGYVERPDSSLIYMVNELMKKSNQRKHDFFSEPGNDFIKAIELNQQNNIATILFGVSFSLLEFANKHPISLQGIKLIETGGMKGRMEEITRDQLHTILKTQLQLNEIYSEYGMTELLSQAYSTQQGEFTSPPWMHVLIRETNDPRSYQDLNKTGGMNIIDLANIHSCCFIATGDLGKKTNPNTFEVLGRFDNADIRGCNLLFP